jgi:hypothetical protein
MALNYAGLHLVAENFVTRPKSDQPYTNKLAETIHGASAYVIPHKVENRHRQQIEALCGSPQIQRIRTIMANSRASFGASVAAPTSAPPLSPPAAIPQTARQAKSAAKQESRNLSVEAQEANAQERQARREGEAAIAEARRLSTAKKALKTPAAKSAKAGFTAAGFLTARSAKSSAKSSAKKVEFATPVPRVLAKDFERETETPRRAAPKSGGGASAESVGGGGSDAASAPPTPSPASAVTSSRADSINATIAQVEGAAGRIKVVATSREGKGAKGFQPAYIGDDGVIRGYKSADITEEQLTKMITEFTKVRARLADKKEKQDITNFISRIKTERDSR